MVSDIARMEGKDIRKAALPDAPGVYFFRDARGRVLYVGRATSLRDRVRSYFAHDLIQTRGPRIVDMVTRAKKVTWRQTDSVLEALLLEAQCIKHYQPPANVEGKDDKSFYHVITTREDIPRVLLVRERELERKFPPDAYRRRFGPFPHGGQLKEALRIIRKIFPFYDTPRPVAATAHSKYLSGKVIFNRQIGLYPDVATAEARRRYRRSIRHIELLFSGNKEGLLRQLAREMAHYARAERFEEAARVRDQIFALQHLRDVALLKKKHDGEEVRIEAYDVAHFSGAAPRGVMVVWQGTLPLKSAYRLFSIRSARAGDDVAALAETLQRRLAHRAWPLPALIVVDGSVAQIRAARAVLRAAGVDIPVVGVVKDRRHKPVRIEGNVLRGISRGTVLAANAEAHRFALHAHRRALRAKKHPRHTR